MRNYQRVGTVENIQYMREAEGRVDVGFCLHRPKYNNPYHTVIIFSGKLPQQEKEKKLERNCHGMQERISLV